jgi:putative tricarboxylic transport membrane protein
MESLGLLLNGFAVALEPQNLVAVLVGVVLGQIIGALPGIGPSLGMALLLPITFGMAPVSAIVLLSGIMYGAMYGGTLTSVLINVPGESSGIMTTLEGHKLARKGRAGAALSMAAIGSFIAGTATVFVLIFLAVTISKFAVMFAPPEYFLLAAVGLIASASMGEGSALKAMFMAVVGLMLALVGTDPILGTERLTFGLIDLYDGIDFLPVAIGVFGIAEVLVSLERMMTLKPIRTSVREMWPRWSDWVQCRMAILRGTVIGFVLGVLPGVGPTASTFIAYGIEKRFTKRPQDFGHGSLDAVASVESANNSAVVGSLVPMLSLGIPGSGLTAVLLAAFILQGIRPGPMLMIEQPDLAWGLIASLFLGNLILLVINLPLAPAFASLLRIPYAYLAPGILLLSVLGAYASTLRLFTVGLALAFGVVGYLMIKARLPRAPLILGIVLAPIMEQALRQSMIMSRGSVAIFVERPISLVLLIAAVVGLVMPFAGGMVTARRRRARARLTESQSSGRGGGSPSESRPRNHPRGAE